MASVSGSDSRPATVTLIWSGVMQLHRPGVPSPARPGDLGRLSSRRLIRPSRPFARVRSAPPGPQPW